MPKRKRTPEQLRVRIAELKLEIGYLRSKVATQGDMINRLRLRKGAGAIEKRFLK